MRDKQDQPPLSTNQSGLRVMTVALTMILLAFFIVLNSIAVVDERHRIEAIGSLLGSFGILPGGLSPMMGKGKSISPQEAPMIAEKETIADLLGTIKMKEPLSVSATPKGNLISIQDDVLFDAGSRAIKPASYGLLKGLCEIINQHGSPVQIIAHTDNVPPDEEAPFESNWELSALKAQEVLKFFAVIGNIDPSRLIAYGRADFDPVASNATRQTRAQNRRIEILLDHTVGETLGQMYRKKPSGFFVFKRFLFKLFD